MKLSRRAAAFLLAVSAFNVFQWTTFIRNLARDKHRPTAFYVVHAVLIAVNLAVTGGLASIGLRAWRARPDEPAVSDRTSATV